MPLTAAALAEPPPGASVGQTPGSEFAPLLRTVKNQGLLKRRHGWYAREIAVNALALAGVITGVALIGNSWWSQLLAPALAVLAARTAFIGHDAGHSQITGSSSVSRLIGLLHGNLLLGMSYSWWNDFHNAIQNVQKGQDPAEFMVPSSPGRRVLRSERPDA